MVGLECGRCSLVWNVNEQSSGPRFRSGRREAAQDGPSVARFTTHEHVRVVVRSPLGYPSRSRSTPRASRRFTCRRSLKRWDRSRGKWHTRDERKARWVSGGQEEDEGRPRTRVSRSSPSYCRHPRTAVIPPCRDQQRRRRTGRAAGSCYARKASAQRSVHNCTAFVSARGRGGGGKGKGKDDDDEEEEAVA